MKKSYKTIFIGSLVLAIPFGLFAYSGTTHYNENGHNNHSKFEHFKADGHNNHKNINAGHNIHNQSHTQGTHFENEGKHEEPKSHLSNK